MPDGGLLVNLALVLIAATIGGAVAVRLRQSAIVGYIVAGVLVGPYTPGPVGELGTVGALADIGVIFLLFAIGLQLSLTDLLRVGRVAIVGGSAQVLAMIVVGYLVATSLGFAPLESLFFGAFVSNSSSTVLAKILSERGETDTEHGHVGFAWSTVQDLSTVVLVVVLSAVASPETELGADLLVAVIRALLFLAIVLPLGLRVMPMVFERVALMRSREIFVLTAVAIALGTAWASEQFGLSLALGAFLAGVLIGESDISHQVVGELTPLRDVFAGLFFVSIGMLVNPAFIVSALPLVLIAVAVVVIFKGALSGLIGRAFGLPWRTAVLVGAVLAQSAEFSFVLARLGAGLGAVGEPMFSLMLSAAGASIVLSPWLHRYAPVAVREVERRYAAQPERSDEPEPTDRPPPVIICGYGRVGRTLGAALERRGYAFQVIDIDPRVCHPLREHGIPVLQGAAENPHQLSRAALDQARVLVVTVPDPLAMRQIVHQARRENRRLAIVARARSAADREFLQREGVAAIVSAEVELAVEMARFTLMRLGVSSAEAQAIGAGLRRRATGG